MCNDIASQATDDADGGYVESKEVLLCHFLGLAYPNTPDSTAHSTAR